MFADIIKFAFSSAELVQKRGCSFTGFYDGSYQEDVKFMFW